jgi:hypothetical protein
VSARVDHTPALVDLSLVDIAANNHVLPTAKTGEGNGDGWSYHMPASGKHSLAGANHRPWRGGPEGEQLASTKAEGGGEHSREAHCCTKSGAKV